MVTITNKLLGTAFPILESGIFFFASSFQLLPSAWHYCPHLLTKEKIFSSILVYRNIMIFPEGQINIDE